MIRIYHTVLSEFLIKSVFNEEEKLAHGQLISCYSLSYVGRHLCLNFFILFQEIDDDDVQDFDEIDTDAYQRKSKFSF